MNNFEMLTKIRNKANRNTETLSNIAELTAQGVINSEAKAVHLLWLYPDITNIHGGRGDIMAFMHVANLLELPLEIRRCDSLQDEIDWSWPDIVYLTAGELKCAKEIIEAIKPQLRNLDIDLSNDKTEIITNEDFTLNDYIAKGGYFIANGSSGAVLADRIYINYSGEKEEIEGLGLLHMTWTQKEQIWGDDIWLTTSDGIEIIGNQIQLADVELAPGQDAFGTLEYGRGNNGITAEKLGKGSSTLAGIGSGLEGARTNNVIYTSVLGPLCTKNPEFTASILEGAAKHADISIIKKLDPEDIKLETISNEYIKRFMKIKMSDSSTLNDVV